MLTPAEIDNVRERLVHARLCCEGWWLLTGIHEEREDIVSVANRYIHFFGTIQPALFCTFVTKTATLFDEDSRSLALSAIPYATGDPLFDKLHQSGRELYKYRSKVIAHSDRQGVKKDFARETGFTNNSLRAVIFDACELFNRCALQSGFSECPDFSFEDDFLELINDLKP